MSNDKGQTIRLTIAPPDPRAVSELGGADRDRTGGLLVANQALSQLSYSPLTPVASAQLSVASENHWKLAAGNWPLIFWWAWVELNYRPHPYQGCALAT